MSNKTIKKEKKDKKKIKKKSWCKGGNFLLETRTGIIVNDRGRDFYFDNTSVIPEKTRCPYCNKKFKLRARFCHDGCCAKITVPPHKTTKEKAKKGDSDD